MYVTYLAIFIALLLCLVEVSEPCDRVTYEYEPWGPTLKPWDPTI